MSTWSQQFCTLQFNIVQIQHDNFVFRFIFSVHEHEIMLPNLVSALGLPLNTQYEIQLHETKIDETN